MNSKILFTLSTIFIGAICGLTSCGGGPKKEAAPNPAMAGAYQERAVHHSIQGNKDSALYLIDKAIAAKPDDAESYQIKISIYEVAGNTAATIATAKEAEQKFPDLTAFSMILAVNTERQDGLVAARPLYKALLGKLEAQKVYNEETAYISTITDGKEKGLAVLEQINDLPPQSITIMRNEINNYQNGGLQEFQDATNTIAFLYTTDVPGPQLHNYLYDQGINFQNLAVEGDGFLVEVKAKFKEAALALGMTLKE